MALTRVAPAGIGSTPGIGITIGNSFLHTTGLESTNANFSGIVTAQSFRVTGDFQVDGTTTTLDTVVTSVDKLEVEANNNTVGVAITQSGAGDILNLYDGSTEVFTVKDGGRVGIGTDGPLAKLEVYTDSNDIGGIVQVIQDGTGDASIDFQLKGTREYTLGIDNSDGDKFKLSGSAGLGSNDLITVTSTGSVGIGTDNPSRNLTVASGSSSGYIQLCNDASGIGSTDGFHLKLDSQGLIADIIHREDGPLRFWTDNTEKLRITSDGDITTSGLTGVTAQTGNTFYESDSRIVQIDGGDSQGWLALGSSRSDTDAYVGGINFVNRYGQQDHHRFLGYIRLKSAHVPGYGANILKGQLEFTTKSSSATISTTTPDMVISHNGNVGIGTDNPNGDLEVFNSNQAVSIVRGNKSTLAILGDDSNSGASETDARIILGSDGTIANNLSSLTTSPLASHGFEIALINEEPGSGLRFHDGTLNKERLRIASNGRVGIGTDNPYYLLDVYKSTGTNQDVFAVRGQTSAFLVQCSDLSAANPTWNLRSFASEDITIKPGNEESVRFKADGKVGIGTDDPTAHLQVYRETSFADNPIIQARSNNGSTNELKFEIDGNGDAYFNGKVGIGTDSPDNLLHLSGTNTTVWPFGSDVSGTYAYTPYPHELQIQNHARDVTGSFAGIYFHSGASADGSYMSAARIAAIDSGNYRSDLAFGTRNTNFGERLRIKYDGNIGIGTDNPSGILHVKVNDSTTYDASGTGAAQQYGGATLSLQNTDSTANNYCSINFLTKQSATGGSRIVALNSGNNESTLTFITESSGTPGERLRITSDGKLGINTTTPTAPLSIKVGSGGEYVQDFRGSAAKQFGFFYDQNNWNAATFRIDEFDSNGTATSRFSIYNGGKVGIGTGSPASILHTRGSSDQTVTIQTTTAGADSRINFRNSGGSDAGGIHYKHNGNHLTFLTGGSLTEQVRITSSGDVGINTNSPEAPLHVATAANTATIAIFGSTDGTTGSTYQALAIKNDVASYPAIVNVSSTDTIDVRSAGSVQVTIDHNNNDTSKFFRVTANGTGGSGTELFRVNENGRVAIGRDDPSCLLDIREYTNTSGTNTGTTMLRLQNNVGSDSANLGDITGVNGQRTYIDFTFIDANANFTPQVRIGAQVGKPSGSDAGIENEGSGSFIVYTAKGSGNAGSGTLSEKLKVTPNGNVRASNGYICGGSNAAGMFQLAASAGNTVVDTGISVNASNGGGAMMVLASRNTSDQTATAAGMYLLDFRYNGNHVPGVTFIGGDNFCLFSKNGSNNLTVNCQSGNWSVAAFFGGYGIGNQLNA